MTAVLPVVCVTGIFLARMVELRTKRPTDAGVVRERLTFYLFMVAGVLMMVSGIAEFFWRGQGLQWATFVLGWICGLLSFYIRHQAIDALGRYWSVHVEIRPEHRLILSGPFRWMRHPTYFSMILEMLAVALILNAYGSLLAVCLIFIPALWLRLSLEEAAMVEKFGAAYQHYQQSTPAIFPYKWPSKN